MIWRGAAVAALLGGSAAPALAVTPPAPGLTKAQAATAFARAVLGDCLVSREQGVMIADLPAADRGELHPAAPEDRALVPDKAAPTWTTDALGGHMVVYEPSAERCNVVADQLPVDSTFRFTVQIAQQFPTPLAPVYVKPGYNPIVYQVERLADGQRYVVHLEGAEPGGFGHTSRFSLLQAWVVREPANAKPMFR